jgi:NADH-quinone oxidoreductase subunit D
MESLIHHFKLWTEGFPAPKASIYSAVESPRGKLGVLLEGDGGPKPLRVHMRRLPLITWAVIPQIVKGTFGG